MKKNLEKTIAKLLVKISFYLTYPIKVKPNRVSIISYFNNEYGLEFTALVDQLEKNNIEVKSSLNHFKASPLGKLRYLFSFIHQTYLFNTSALIILDGNSFVDANINKKTNTKTYQLWHALGAIKKFGEERRYENKPYDYVIVSSDYFKKPFSLALNTPLNNIYSLGNIKSDYLFNKEYLDNLTTKFYLKYPELKNKNIVLYAPTFRGTGLEDMQISDGNINELKTKLGEDYHLIVKQHPLIVNNDYNNYDDDLYTLLNIADFVISDYSALVFDAVILNKPIILYLYDYEEYKKTRGFFLDPMQLGLKVTFNINDLYDIILEGEFDKVNQQVRNKFLTDIDGESLTRVSHQILDILKDKR